MGNINHSLSVTGDLIELTVPDSIEVNRIVYNGKLYSPVAPVLRGEWIPENARPKSSMFICSVCHRTAYDPQPNRIAGAPKRCRYAYCPNCGADMRGERYE